MGSLTNAGEDIWIGHLCAGAYTTTANVFLALATADPGEAATGASMNEVANSGGYVRKPITFGAAASRKVAQNAIVTFDQSSGTWGTVTHWAITNGTAHGSGTALAYGAFGTAKSVVNGNTPSVASGQIEVSVNAGAFTDNCVHSMLNFIFRNVSYSQPTTKAALYTTTCSDSAAGTEVTGGDYAQVTVNKAGGASPKWEAVSSGATQNADAITFTTATASWGTVVASGIVDAGGTLLFYDNATADQLVSSGDTVQYAAGAWDVAIT